MAKRDIITRTVKGAKGEVFDITMPKLNRVIAPVSEEFMVALRIFEHENSINETALARKAVAQYIGFTGKTSDSTERVVTDKAKEQAVLERLGKTKKQILAELYEKEMARLMAENPHFGELPDDDDDLDPEDEPEEEEEEEPEA